MTRVAALDLGTNSFHLLVADTREGGRITRVLTRKLALRLAEPLARTGELGKEARRRAVDAAATLVAEARANGAQRAVVVATDALRDAPDGDRLRRRLEEDHGLAVHVLAGLDEAALSLRGMAASLEVPAGRAVLGFDLGGGSFEVAYGGADGLRAGASLPLGASRLREELAAAGVGDPPRLVHRAALLHRVLDALRPVADEVRREAGGTPPAAVGTAGTIRDLGRVGLALAGGRAPARVRGLVVTRDQLERAVALLASMATGDRLDVPGVSGKRADLLPVGGVVLLGAMEALDLEQLALCDWGLREGALLDALGGGPVLGRRALARL